MKKTNTLLKTIILLIIVSMLMPYTSSFAASEYWTSITKIDDFIASYSDLSAYREDEQATITALLDQAAADREDITDGKTDGSINTSDAIAQAGTLFDTLKTSVDAVQTDAQLIAAEEAAATEQLNKDAYDAAVATLTSNLEDFEASIENYRADQQTEVTALISATTTSLSNIDTTDYVAALAEVNTLIDTSKATYLAIKTDAVISAIEAELIAKAEKTTLTVSGDASTELGFTVSKDSVSNLFEESEILSGDDLSVSLNVSNIVTEDVTESDAKLVADAIKSYDENNKTDSKVEKYLDITLAKTVGTTTSSITDSNGNITMTFNISEELLSTDKTFKVIRIHDGVATILDDLDTNSSTFTMESDAFSTYALVSVENVTELDETPNTGIQTNSNFVISVAAIILLAGVASYNKKRI